jgi:hypothetical protein
MSQLHYKLPATNPTRSQSGEKGYPWLFFQRSRSWYLGLAVTLVVVGLSGAFYAWYRVSAKDLTPFSPTGVWYGVIGTVFLVFAAVLYSLRRRSRKRATGQLNASLNWHIFIAVMGLAILFMHSFGHFDPISGTYALLGMVVLALSGLAGRMLDRLIPRLIAQEVDKVLTSQGDDRIEVVSQELQAIVVHNKQQVRGFMVRDPRLSSRPVSSNASTSSTSLPATGGQPLGISWDLAYISLEPTQQELDRDAPRYRFVPDKKSALSRPEILMPGTEEPISELKDMHKAMQREQFYRYIIRYWRVLHIALAFTTLGLVTWHIIFVTHLMLPGLLH